MKMADELQSRLENWVRDKCSHLKCALCQSVRWKVGDLLLPVRANPADEPSAEEPLMAQLVCKNCAHVVLFDVRRIIGWREEGVIDPSKTMIF
ncbi:MAG TPA: hypothetical protein VHY91_19755 [Pirellulales bacterium]|jgi:hypothetical protein|nr:hypothetical protein [Pirellulales bacterium]HEX4145751.1 hypothetical protein [Pirellulales bacterium]